ncbi:Putative restriction endonuclease [Neomoorella glycerini]|uniref:Restriction endonuclease n=1 Tax=Neomoorella glycerini TaxID=55779 RepID=A0A6I5ZQ78_9FIRM|nr:Uma2 family endonuclease [Moorella glycerini]QGP92122.1 Putative restriction endonuclease [Moorella glycerini]
MSLALKEIATSKDKVYTYDDYCRLPEGAPYQLIGGELVLTPSPTSYHQIISMQLVSKMVAYVTTNDLGIVLDAPLDVYLEETETYQPDILFISRERLNIIKKEKIIGAPDLVVEILSPTTAYYDLRKKYRIYEKHGVREYWLVDPEERCVQVYIAEAGKFKLDQEVEKKGIVCSRVIEGFSIDAAAIFHNPLVASQ